MHRLHLIFVLLLVCPFVPRQAVAQSSFDGQATTVHSNLDFSSNSSMMTALKAAVTEQPYEARKVTRSSWKLADGTTISHESATKIARDAEGRVREEVEQIHSSSLGGHEIDRTTESITIADPVEHAITILSAPPMKIAIRMQLPNLAQPKQGSVIASLAAPPPSPPGRTRTMRQNLNAAGDDVQVEELGSDALDGLNVTRRRTTTTIPAGKIGNDRPILITHEEWYSPDLKLVVKSRDYDPRTGERTIELEDLVRKDPDPALFTVPAGYKVEDMAGMLRSVGRAWHTGADSPQSEDAGKP